MKFLLTGSNGFIGSYFAKYYGQNYSIETFSFLKDNFETLHINNIDVVMHLAALVHQKEKMNESEYIKSNISFLNFSFITHSPFVLSDVTYNDVMALDGDGKQVKEIGYCFASNIYDLLNSNFFMKSFMGRFAETKIDQVIAIINIYKLIRNNLNADLNIDLQTKYKEFYNIEKKESLNPLL